MSDVTSDDEIIRVDDHGDSDDDAWCRVQLYWAVLILASCCSAEPSLSHYRPHARLKALGLREGKPGAVFT